MEEDEELRELPGPSSQVDDDPEVTQFYVNPIAKPIPQGRTQTSLQDTISELNMHKATKNGLEVSKERSYSKYVNYGSERGCDEHCLDLIFDDVQSKE